METAKDDAFGILVLYRDGGSLPNSLL